MKVTVKPVDTEKWYGKKGKESFSRPQSLEVLYDTATGGYATGLNKEEEEKYSALIGMPLDNKFNPDVPHPYWSSPAAKISLPNHTIIFDTDRAAEFVKVKNLKASRFVANSLKEWEDGLWPDATHVIFDEAEEVEVKASKIAKKNSCIIVASKLTLDEKLNIVQILSNKSFKGRSADFVDVEIDKIIEEDADSFIRITKMNKQEVSVRAIVMEGIYRHKLIKDGLSITYMGETVGHDIDDAVAYFLNPDNQAIKVALLEKLSD